MLVAPSSPHGSEGGLTTLEYIVGGLYTIRYLIALPPRVQLMGQLVPSAEQRNIQTSSFARRTKLLASSKPIMDHVLY